jgi:hypothetical protein
MKVAGREFFLTTNQTNRTNVHDADSWSKCDAAFMVESTSADIRVNGFAVSLALVVAKPLG